MVTAKDFAEALLTLITRPVTENNVRSIVAWIGAEGGHYKNGARYNPLNTTWRMPGDRFFGAVVPAGKPNVDYPDVRAYASWRSGLEATAKTLQNGYYPKILAALDNDADPEVTIAAIKASPWGTYNLNPGTAAKFAAAGMSYADPTPNEGGSLWDEGEGGSIAAAGAAGGGAALLLLLVLGGAVWLATKR